MCEIDIIYWMNWNFKSTIYKLRDQSGIVFFSENASVDYINSF